MATRSMIAGAIFIGTVGASGLALGQSTTDPFEGATVSANSPALANDNPAEIFGGTPTAVEPGSFLFNDGAAPTGGDFINFSTAAPVAISGVNLYIASDTGLLGADRSTGGFRLFADTNNDAVYETTLVPTAVPNNNGAFINTYLFGSVTASAFRAESTAPT